MRVVTMCQGGQVRSVGLKYLLHYKHGHDAIACGWQSNTEETRRLLFEWAEVIVIMQPNMEKYVPDEFHERDGKRRLYCYDVGPDNYHNSFNERLQIRLTHMIESHKLFVR